MSVQGQVHPMQPTAPPQPTYDNASQGQYSETERSCEPIEIGFINMQDEQLQDYPPPAYNKPPPAYPLAPQSYQAAPQASTAEMHPMAPSPQPNNELDVGKSFSNKAIRHAFIKKVYLILMLQLAVTVGIICLFIFVNPIKEWVQYNSWAYWMSYGIFFVTYIVMICIPSVRRNSPGNLICLFIFTLALSYMTATISSYYDTTIVFIALAITTGVCVGISLFAIQTKIDFTMCAGLLFALVMVLIWFGFACLIAYLVVDDFTAYIMNIVYAGLAALIFSLFLVFDTQMVVGGKNRKYQLSPEEYITGALQLYLDVVYLFLAILGLSGAAAH